MQYYNVKSVYYIQVIVISSLILIISPVFKGAIPPFWGLIFIAGMFFYLWKIYKSWKTPVVVTNDVGLKINHGYNKLIYWSDINSIKEGLLVKYKIIHKNGEIVLPIACLSKDDRDHLLKKISTEIEKT